MLAPDAAPAPQPDLAGQIEAERGGGSPLDAGQRAGLETHIGADLSGVRVHTGPKADSLSRAVEAEAFTIGQDIFFREGRYNPGSSDGQALLAHEVTHTVQQARGPVDGQDWGGGVKVSDPGDRFEQEADAAARTVQRLATGQLPGATTGSPPAHGQTAKPGDAPVLQRAPAPGATVDKQTEKQAPGPSVPTAASKNGAAPTGADKPTAAPAADGNAPAKEKWAVIEVASGTWAEFQAQGRMGGIGVFQAAYPTIKLRVIFTDVDKDF